MLSDKDYINVESARSRSGTRGGYHFGETFQKISRLSVWTLCAIKVLP